MSTVRKAVTFDFAAGYRTYVIGMLSVLKGAAGFFYPDSGVSDNPALDIQIGLGLMGLRAAR